MKIAWLSVCVALVGGAMAGCASTPPSAQVDSPVSRLEIKFENQQTEDALSKFGLVKNYTAYWQAHKSRNWVTRFLLEDLNTGLTEKFYVAYHERAWPLKSISVMDVKGDADAATVSMAYTFANPETAQDITYAIADRWVRVGGAWKHVVGDPMLSAIK